MRNSIAAAVFFIAFNVTAGTITSIDNPSIPTKSGEYFMTVTGSGLGDVFVYDGPTGPVSIDVSADDRAGHVIAWIPQEVINTPGLYSLVVKGGLGDSGPVNFTVSKPGRPILTLHLPEILVALAESRLGTGIKYYVSALGGEGTPTVKCDPPSGSTFPFGKSIIRCVATDLDGGRAEGEIAVSVVDVVAPVLALPKSFEVPTDLQEGAYVKYEAWAKDDIDVDILTTCLPGSGALFRPGRTTVNCEAVDASLNPAYGSFEVMVRPKDIGRLEIRVPADFKVAAQSKEGAIVDYEVTAFGSADPDPVVECTPASGTDFKMGLNKVYCIATDDFDQRAENGFIVEVVDGDVLQLKDVAEEATGPGGADVPFEKEAEGWTAEITCSQESGSRFPIGTTTVDCHSTDERGRRAEGSFTVTVADTIAPHIASVRATPGAADAEQNVAVKVEVDAIDAADAMPRCSVSGIEGGHASITSDLAVSVRHDADLRIQVTCVDSAGNRATEGVAVRLGAIGRRRATSN